MTRPVETITGDIICLGDNITAEMICPAEYQSIAGTAELARHALEGCGADYPSKLKPVSVLVAGINFGSGCRDTLPIQALRAAGIKCIIAASFGRSFYRRAINNGLALVTLEFDGNSAEDQPVSIDLVHGRASIGNKQHRFPAFPPRVLRLLEEGDLIRAVKKELGKA